MLHMFLICYDPQSQRRDDEPTSLQPPHAALEAELRAEGIYESGSALMPVEIVAPVRMRGTTVLGAADGPFAESREVVGGYYVVDCRDAEHAQEIASRIPVASNAWIQIRQVPLYRPK